MLWCLLIKIGNYFLLPAVPVEVLIKFLFCFVVEARIDTKTLKNSFLSGTKSKASSLSWPCPMSIKPKKGPEKLLADSRADVIQRRSGEKFIEPKCLNIKKDLSVVKVLLRRLSLLWGSWREQKGAWSVMCWILPASAFRFYGATVITFMSSLY